ncbi:MAG: tyrosine-protein phosphatase [Lachnospiraceae bacterium]
MKRNWIRLPLKGACNVRELGGLPAMKGGQTQWHQFLRADNLHELTEDDVEMLLEYGVSMVIDLRSRAEMEKNPDHIGVIGRVVYCNVPFLEEDLSPEGQAAEKERLADLSNLYLRLLKRKTVIKDLFTCIAGAPDGCVLFHCAVGKDRTGVLALLLLMLAGVDRQDCQTNYMQSFTNLTRKEWFCHIKESEFNNLIRSDAEYIEAAYDYVAGYEGGIDGFLEDCGIAAECIARVRSRILAG